MTNRLSFLAISLSIALAALIAVYLRKNSGGIASDATAMSSQAANKIYPLPTGFLPSTFACDDQLLVGFQYRPGFREQDLQVVRVSDRKAQRTIKDFRGWPRYLPATHSLLGIDGFDGSVSSWDTRTWAGPSRFVLEPEVGPEKRRTVEEEEYEETRRRDAKLDATAVSPDGRFLVAVTWYQNLKIWDLPSRRLVTELPKPHGGFISVLDFSPDGHKLVSIGDNGSALLWSVPEWKLIAQWPCQPHPWLLKFAPDGSAFAAAISDGKASVWTLTGQLQGSFELNPQGYSRLLLMAFSPDSKFIAAAGGMGIDGPGLIAVWDWRQGREVFRLQTPDQVSSLCFAKNWLAWSAEEASIMEWPPPEQQKGLTDIVPDNRDH